MEIINATANEIPAGTTIYVANVANSKVNDDDELAIVSFDKEKGAAVAEWREAEDRRDLRPG